MSRFNVDNYAKFKIDVVYYQDVKDKSKIYAVEIDMATPQDIQVLTDKNQPTLKLDTDDYRESSAKQRYERQTKYKVKKADGKLLRDKNNKVITYSNKATAQKKSKELKGKVEPIKIKATKYKKSELLRDESGRFLSRGETESLKSISEKTKKPLKDIVGKKLAERKVDSWSQNELPFQIEEIQGRNPNVKVIVKTYGGTRETGKPKFKTLEFDGKKIKDIATNPNFLVATDDEFNRIYGVVKKARERKIKRGKKD